MQLITKSGSFPVHSLCAAAAIPELTPVAMLAQDCRYINQEWSNWQCQNKRRNELRFPRMKVSDPRGVQLSHLRKSECRPFINFLVTKHRTPHNHSDVGQHLLWSRIIPVAHVLDTHRKSIVHLPPPCWALALPQPHTGFLCFFL